MNDNFKTHYKELTSPADIFVTITPSNTRNSSTEVNSRAIYVGTGGNITVVGVGMDDGATGVLFSNVPSGMLLPIRVKYVLASGTTATNMVAMI